MDTVWQDLRYALRQFVRRPGFTAIAVLSLGIAIGANSLIYGLVDGFVFHPFPYPQPDRLVAVGVTFPKLSSETTYVESLSPAEYLDIRAEQKLRAHRVVRSRQPQHLGRRCPGARVHGAPARRPLSGARHGAGTGARLHARRARSERSSGRDHQPSSLADALRRRSQRSSNRAIRISGRTSVDRRRHAAGACCSSAPICGCRGAAIRLDVPRNVRQFNILARLAPGCVAGAGERRARRHRAPRRAGRAAEVCGVRELAPDGDAMGGGAPQGRAAGGVRSARRRRARAAHRVRQPDEPLSRALLDAAARARRAPGAWRRRARVSRDCC